MPKRKRELDENGGDRVFQARKQDVFEKYAQSKKLLHRALKTAKGFERQKLGKRLKLATSNNLPIEIARINREIEALKGLELGKATDAYLHRSLLRIKAFVGSEFLPEEVSRVIPKPEGTEEMAVALHNVTSGMCNTKQVKEVMGKVLSGMYLAMGLPTPMKKVKGGKKEQVKGILKDSKKPVKIENFAKDKEIEKESAGTKREELAFGGFDSVEDDKRADDDIESESGSDGDQETRYVSLSEEDISRYEALLGGSSDEESFDEEQYAKNRPSKPANTMRQYLSLSPSPSRSQKLTGYESDSDLDLDSAALSPPTLKTPKSTKTKQPAPLKPSGSTFLPTLMGGYWSGSESPSEIEDSAAPIKKNRPGQMARRAIWEKRYGKGANHIKTGKGLVTEKREKDDGGRRRGRGGDGGRQRNLSQVTGENAITVEPRKRGLGKKDDVGVLHPSWQAAKKAKDMKKAAKFEGKKVTFD